MYDNLVAKGLGNFAADIYWTSSETSANNATAINMSNRSSGIWAKISSTYRARACRTFTEQEGFYKIGDTGQAGGLIFYIDGTTYYEAALVDQTTSNTWTDTTGLIGTGTAVGTGQANTNLIIAQTVVDSKAAAYDCDIYSVTVPDYSSLTIETEWKDQDDQEIAHRILRTLGVSIDQRDVAEYAQQLKSES